MYIFLIVVHITVCIILIAVILLQAGRGGGLTEALGGETAQSILGTQAPVILKRATTISAILFLVTSLVLGMVTARRGMSLFDRTRLPIMPSSAGPSASETVPPGPAPSAPSGEAPVQDAPAQAEPGQTAPIQAEESVPAEK